MAGMQGNKEIRFKFLLSTHSVSFTMLSIRDSIESETNIVPDPLDLTVE